MDLPSPSAEQVSEDDSACLELAESDTLGPCSTSTGSEIKPQKEFFVHKVSKLDTLAGLAVFDIKKANGLVSDNCIYARESLIIPLQPSVSEGGRMGVDAMQPWNGLSSISERASRYQASTSQASTSSCSRPVSRGAALWDSFMAVDDQQLKAASEIELEMLDDERLRQEILLQKHWREQQHSSKPLKSYPKSSSSGALMRAPPKTAAASNVGSVSEYLTSMATSFIKTTEQLFSSTHFSSSSSEGLYEKFKKAASRSSLYGGSTSDRGGSRERLESAGRKRASEPKLSSASRKDTSKLD